MTNEDLLREIMSLPADAKRKVEKYVDYPRRSKTVPASSIQLEEEEFFGIWRDRDEMRDSTAWVRNIRETHWSK
jgi:hypothetical protein